MIKPGWLVEAEKHIGQSEVAGVGSNTWIKNLWLGLKGGAWYWSSFGSDDSRLPWCGAFCAAMMKICGLDVPAKYASAKEWLDWGRRLIRPELGCIVVFERGAGGHVGFVVGETADGYLMVLGGNQGNKVSIAPFARDRVLGYVWPVGVPTTETKLALLDRAGQPLSTNEA